MLYTTDEIQKLIHKMTGEDNEEAFKASDTLARIGTPEVAQEMTKLLQHDDLEVRILAARTLGKFRENSPFVKLLLDAVSNPQNREIAGDILMSLEDMDVSAEYVELFRLYLFGSFKVSTVAKGFLDFKEFDLAPRTIRKAEKHWNHYQNNVKQDEVFELKKHEVEEMLADLRQYLGL